jgi:hypothetical protein
MIDRDARSNGAMNPTGDRRALVRLEIVGSLRGVLELTEVARIVNISDRGALVEAPIAVALESTQSVRLIIDGRPILVDARVRHVRRAAIEGDVPQYLIGVEFLSVPPALLRSVEHLSETDRL